VLTGASYADSPTEAQSTQAQIAELKAEIAQLKGDNWLTEQRAEQIRSLVQDVLADADTRSSLLQSGMTAGYDNGFVLGSSDGNFSLKMNGLLQARYIYDYRDSGPNVDQNREGFENTRTRLTFSGNVGGQQWMYKIQGDFNRDGGSFDLEDAWIGYDMGDGWSIYMGQGKLPLQREFLVDEGKQLAVERSQLSYYYGASYTQGVMAQYKNDQMRFCFSYNDGIGNANTAWNAYDTEWSITARAEFMLSGNWEEFEDFNSPPGTEQGVLLGIAADYQGQEYGTPNNNEAQTFILTADATFNFDGWSLFAAVDWANIGASALPTNNPYGFLIQGGFYLNDEWEIFARFEYNDYDNNAVNDLNVITAGVSGFYSKNVKMTADIGWSINEIILPNTITGFQSDAPGQDNQIVARLQLQLSF
jgi:hypothetical protein